MKNVLALYKLTKTFNLPTTAKQSLSYIESSFTILAEEQNFFELDYSLAAKIFASSELHITSELEVYNSAIAWLSYNKSDRKVYAKQILLKVRFNLLSVHALQYILNESSLSTDLQNYSLITKNILQNKEMLNKTKNKSFNSHRYCNHSRFNILVYGGFDQEKRLRVQATNLISGRSLKPIKTLAALKVGMIESEAVCIKDKVYIFGGYNDNMDLIRSVQRYSAATEAWNEVAEIPGRRAGYRVCAFTNKIYIVGGYVGRNSLDSCLQFDTKDHEWKAVGRMNDLRKHAAVTAFEGELVVSGGYNGNNDLKSVESYDVFAGHWLPMPNMVREQYYHKSFVVKNKLFVAGMGCDNLEVFESSSRKFASVKAFFLVIAFARNIISVGDKFYAFDEECEEAIAYDCSKGEWSKIHLNWGRKISGFACAKVPFF